MSGSPAVLFVTHDASRTGAPMVLLHLLRWLKKAGSFPFAVLVKDGGPLEDEFRAVGPAFVMRRPPRYPANRVGKLAARFADALRVRRLVRWAKGQNVGLVYSNTVINGDLTDVFQRLGRPVVTHVHELEYLLRLEGMTGSGSLDQVKATTRRYVAAARAVADNLVRNHGVDPGRVSVHHEFIRTADWRAGDPVARAQARAKLDIPADAVVVLGSGTLDWRKGADLFAQVAGAAGRRVGNLWFVWVGGDRRGVEQLRHDAARLGVLDRLRTPGVVSDPEAYFVAADLFLLTSREDPFPLVMLEAAAAGLPVVCFADGGGGPEFVESDAGAVVPYLDLVRMVEAVVGLATDPGLRERLGRRAAEKVRERHDVEVAAPKLAAEIRDLLGAA